MCCYDLFSFYEVKIPHTMHAKMAVAVSNDVISASNLAGI